MLRAPPVVPPTALQPRRPRQVRKKENLEVPSVTQLMLRPVL